MKPLPRSLRGELEWAIEAMQAHGQPSGDQVERIRAAIRAESLLLPKRFGLFIDNCIPYDLESEDRNRLGTLLLALEAWAGGQPFRLYQPGEWESTASTKGTQVQFRCTASWKARLQAYCQRSGTDASTLIRKAVEAYLAGNPLWMSQEDRLLARAIAEEQQEPA